MVDFANEEIDKLEGFLNKNRPNKSLNLTGAKDAPPS